MAFEAETCARRQQNTQELTGVYRIPSQVTHQLEAEKAALLEKKRREQDDARRRQDELERILAENRRKVR